MWLQENNLVNFLLHLNLTKVFLEHPTSFENNVAKGEIAYNDQFIFLPPCFQLFSILKHSLKDNFLIFYLNVFKVVCCRHFESGKGAIPHCHPASGLPEILSCQMSWVTTVSDSLTAGTPVKTSVLQMTLGVHVVNSDLEFQEFV